MEPSDYWPDTLTTELLDPSGSGVEEDGISRDRNLFEFQLYFEFGAFGPILLRREKYSCNSNKVLWKYDSTNSWVQ